MLSNAVYIEIYGKASKKILFEGNISQRSLSKTVLNFLENLSFPIASSCGGEGVCAKCIINENTLSCSLTLSEFMALKGHRIEIEYL